MDRNLQTKLQEFTAKPPEGVWQKVADALHEHESFAQSLHEYEELPPVDIWNKIEKDLEEPVPAKIVPFSVRFKRPIRYAAVACLLAAVLVTITLTVRRTEAGAIAPGSSTTVPGTAATSSDKQKNNEVQSIASSDNETKDTSSLTDSTPSLKSKASDQNIAYASLNGYVFFKDGDGKRRRVSKKLASLVHCGDSDATCLKHLQELRQRLAAKAMTTDFTGILEMMRQLQ